MTDKPTIYYCAGVSVSRMESGDVAVIRLADHQAVAAKLRADKRKCQNENKALRLSKYEDAAALEASRAADKARIAELTEQRDSFQRVGIQPMTERNELLGLLREARELIEHGDFREGHCMCGSDVNRHTIGDGHSPVDAGVYYAGQVMERIDATLAKLGGGE